MNDIGNDYLAHKKIPNVKFEHNSQVRVLTGEYKNSLAYTTSVEKLDPDPIYLLETWDGIDIRVPQSDIAEGIPITNEQLNLKVLEEINENWDLENPHGINLKESLIFPEIIQCSHGDDKLYQYWLVLTEIPNSTEGYKIIYDDESGLFGLAYSQKDKVPTHIGLYGSFIETLMSM